MTGLVSAYAGSRWSTNRRLAQTVDNNLRTASVMKLGPILDPPLQLTAKQHRVAVGETLRLYHWTTAEILAPVKSIQYEVRQVAFWHRRLGLVYCERVAGLVGEDRLFDGMDLQFGSHGILFDYLLDDRRGFRREFVAMEAGVFLVTANWTLDDGREWVSSPTVIVVDRHEGKAVNSWLEESGPIELFEQLHEVDRLAVE